MFGNFCKKHRNALISGIAAGVVVATAPAVVNAQANEDGFAQSIAQINVLVSAIASMTTTFTGLIVTPLGIRSSVRAYDHIVLRNL